MINVRRYEAADRARWDQVVRTARNSHFMFERGYLEYHADRYSDASLLFETSGRLVAVLPAHQFRESATGELVVAAHDGLSFSGFVVSPSMHQGRMDSVFEA